MKLGIVIGTVVCTRKEAALVGKKLLMVQPISPEKKPLGKPIIAVDTIGAGARETVMFVRGKEGSILSYASRSCSNGCRHYRYC